MFGIGSLACKSLNQAGVGTNGILGCELVSKNEHRATVKDAKAGAVCLTPITPPATPVMAPVPAVLCDVISVVAEFMVSITRSMARSSAACACSV
jgi:hypothetical protein